jgi:hypothetical protein
MRIDRRKSAIDVMEHVVLGVRTDYVRRNHHLCLPRSRPHD